MIALSQVLADAGLRLSEAASLVWNDVEWWTDGLGYVTKTVSKCPTACDILTDLRLARKGAGRG